MSKKTLTTLIILLSSLISFSQSRPIFGSTFAGGKYGNGMLAEWDGNSFDTINYKRTVANPLTNFISYKGRIYGLAAGFRSIAGLETSDKLFVSDSLKGPMWSILGDYSFRHQSFNSFMLGYEGFDIRNDTLIGFTADKKLIFFDIPTNKVFKTIDFKNYFPSYNKLKIVGRKIYLGLTSFTETSFKYIEVNLDDFSVKEICSIPWNVMKEQKGVAMIHGDKHFVIAKSDSVLASNDAKMYMIEIDIAAGQFKVRQDIFTAHRIEANDDAPLINDWYYLASSHGLTRFSPSWRNNGYLYRFNPKLEKAEILNVLDSTMGNPICGLKEYHGKLYGLSARGTYRDTSLLYEMSLDNFSVTILDTFRTKNAQASATNLLVHNDELLAYSVSTVDHLSGAVYTVNPELVGASKRDLVPNPVHFGLTSKRPAQIKNVLYEVSNKHLIGLDLYKREAFVELKLPETGEFYSISPGTIAISDSIYFLAPDSLNKYNLYRYYPGNKDLRKINQVNYQEVFNQLLTLNGKIYTYGTYLNKITEIDIVTGDTLSTNIDIPPCNTMYGDAGIYDGKIYLAQYDDCGLKGAILIYDPVSHSVETFDNLSNLDGALSKNGLAIVGEKLYGMSKKGSSYSLFSRSFDTGQFSSEVTLSDSIPDNDNICVSGDELVFLTKSTGLSYMNAYSTSQKKLERVLLPFTKSDANSEFLGSIGYYSSIVEAFKSDKLFVYPNPVRETLNIFGLKAGMEVQVLNSMGQSVISWTKSDQISVSHLSSGIYCIEERQSREKIKFIKL